MKKLLTIFSLFALLVNFAFAGDELTAIWQKSVSQGTLPKWFDTGNLTRGLSFGKVEGNERVYVVSRNGGSFIYILNAATGDSLGLLNNTGITGGTYFVSDVGVSTDGQIFVCNLSINSSFKVYRWTGETAAPQEVIAHAHSGRFGDKMTVLGSAADNSLIILAASANSADILKFTTADNGATFMADTLKIDISGGSASVGPLGVGTTDFYYNATGINARKYSASGTSLGVVPGSVVATGSNAIRYITTTGTTEYFITFQYGGGNENARIVKVPKGDPLLAQTYSISPALGTNANANGTGDVSVKDNGDGTFTVFVLSTNNGLGAYKLKLPIPPIDPVNMTLNWEANVNTYTFLKNDNNTRGIGFNPVTNHILVASRTGAPFIYALDAANGAVMDTLDMTGVTGGTLPLMKVVAEANGVIYACNLALANGEFKIYRWADEKAIPTVAFAGVVAGRTGDAFALTGTGLETVIYGSGSGSNSIFVFTSTDGVSFAAGTPIPVATGTARGGISAISVGPNSDLWINGAGTALRHIAADGSLITEIPGTVVASSWMNVAYIAADNGAKLLAVNANNVTGDIRKLQVWNITESEANPTLWGAAETGFLEFPNGNGAGEIIAKNNGDGTFTIFQLTTNNAIASWKLAIPEVIKILTIAEAKVDANGDFRPDLLGQIVTVKGIVNSPNFRPGGTQYYMQDNTGGVVPFSSSVAVDLKFGDEIQIKGKVDQFRGLTEITTFASTDITVLSSGNPVVPTPAKISQLGEPLEAMLVQVDSVWIVDPTQWPADGANGNVDLTDGVDTTYIFIDKDTDLDGWTPPSGPLKIIALVDQYTSSSTVYNDGYSLRGTYRENFISIGPKFMTIAEAKVDANNDFRPDLLGDTVTVKGVINSPNFRPGGTQYYMQDATGGIVPFSSSVALDLKFGDEIQITAKVDQFRGISELTTFASADVKVLSSGNKIVPVPAKISELGEPLEAMLVQVNNVWIVDPTQWPADGANGNVDITNGVDTTYIFIDKDTDLDGWTPPTGPINIIALVDQYTSSATVYNDGYSLRGTYRENFIPAGPKILTIAEAKVDANSDFIPDLLGESVTIKGVITTPNYRTSGSQYYMQDSTGGIQVFSSPVTVALKYGDEIQITGKIAQYSGATEISEFKAEDVKVLSTGKTIEPLTLKIPDLGEKTEGLLVKLERVWIVDLAQWPVSGSNGNVDITDGVDTTYIFIDKDTDLDGWTPPKGLMNLIAINEQFTSKVPPDDGYSLRGTFKENFIDLTPPPQPTVLTPLWAKTQAAGTFPKFMSTSNYERGMAYGKVNGQDRVYVVTRNGIHRIVIHDAMTGDSLGVIPKPAQSEGVGLFHINAVDVSDDGLIFVCNMSLTSDVASPFRVYKWTSETSDPVTAISYDAALGRMGDMFSVKGSASDNSLTIFAAVANSNKVVKFTTTDNGNTFTPQVIQLPAEALKTVPNVAGLDDGTFYLKTYNKPLIHYDANGAPIDTVSTQLVGTGATKIKSYKSGEKLFVMAYSPDIGGTGLFENFKIVDVTKGAKEAQVVALTKPIGGTTNGNGTGSLDVWHVSDTTFVYYLLGTNNGVAAFTNNNNFVLANLDTLFYGDTATLLTNPYGPGYIAGTNGYGDIGKYQRFDFNPGDELFSFRHFFAVKKIVGLPDTLQVVVRTVGTIGEPGSLIASLPTTTDALDTTRMGNVFFLSSPLKLSGPVFIGFEWSTTTDDSFAVFTDKDGEGNGANRAWEQFSDGKFNDFGRILNPDYSWGIDVDLWIAAYYKKAIPVGVAETGRVPVEFVLHQNYPNPFNPTTTIPVELMDTENIEISVFNIMGQEVAQVFKGKLVAGYHEFQFDAQHLPSGIYFYKLKSQKINIVKKMLLLK